MNKRALMIGMALGTGITILVHKVINDNAERKFWAGYCKARVEDILNRMDDQEEDSEIYLSQDKPIPDSCSDTCGCKDYGPNLDYASTGECDCFDQIMERFTRRENPIELNINQKQ